MQMHLLHNKIKIYFECGYIPSTFAFVYCICILYCSIKNSSMVNLSNYYATYTKSRTFSITNILRKFKEKCQPRFAFIRSNLAMAFAIRTPTIKIDAES